MIRKRGFTLVELLVVIAIIALLMSILMPALARVRKQAKDVICLTNLKQWSVVFSAYTGDYDGYFCGGWQGRPGSTGAGNADDSNWWMDAFRPYYKEPKIRCCPMATKPYDDGAMPPFGAWTDWGFLSEGDYGSYGINGWAEDNRGMEWGLNPNKRWRHCNVQGGSEIPVFMGNIWVDGWPEHYDTPPEFMDDTRVSYEGDYMRRFCMNRHEGRVGGLFMDGGVRLVGLKSLWRIKWNRLFDLAYPLPSWATDAPWMEKFPEPEF
jgi:prepilin-type N-terminal cleavage/methylation domain-containing protein